MGTTTRASVLLLSLSLSERRLEGISRGNVSGRISVVRGLYLAFEKILRKKKSNKTYLSDLFSPTGEIKVLSPLAGFVVRHRLLFVNFRRRHRDRGELCLLDE